MGRRAGPASTGLSSPLPSHCRPSPAARPSSQNPFPQILLLGQGEQQGLSYPPHNTHRHLYSEHTRTHAHTPLLTHRLVNWTLAPTYDTSHCVLPSSAFLPLVRRLPRISREQRDNNGGNAQEKTRSLFCRPASHRRASHRAYHRASKEKQLNF